MARINKINIRLGANIFFSDFRERLLRAFVFGFDSLKLDETLDASKPLIITNIPRNSSSHDNSKQREMAGMRPFANNLYWSEPAGVIGLPATVEEFKKSQHNGEPLEFMIFELLATIYFEKKYLKKEDMETDNGVLENVIISKKMIQWTCPETNNIENFVEISNFHLAENRQYVDFMTSVYYKYICNVEFPLKEGDILPWRKFIKKKAIEIFQNYSKSI